MTLVGNRAYSIAIYCFVVFGAAAATAAPGRVDRVRDFSYFVFLATEGKRSRVLQARQRSLSAPRYVESVSRPYVSRSQDLLTLTNFRHGLVLVNQVSDRAWSSPHYEPAPYSYIFASCSTRSIMRYVTIEFLRQRVMSDLVTEQPSVRAAGISDQALTTARNGRVRRDREREVRKEFPTAGLWSRTQSLSRSSANAGPTDSSP